MSGQGAVGQGKQPGYRVTPSRPARKGPEHNPWYWNPNRVGASEAPSWFKEKLREVDPEGLIDLRWNPIIERWVAFYKNPKLNHPVCQGWTLLFKIQDPRDGSYMPLDERTLATLYNASSKKWGDGAKYFAAIEREMEREREQREKRSTQSAIDRAMPTFEYSQIKNIGKGSKFSDYHA